MDTFQPLSYADISTLHRNLSERDPFFASQSLPQFAAYANELSGSRAFDQGLEDNFAKRASTWLDRFLQPVSNVTGTMGADIGAMVGGSKGEEIGGKIGEGLPRGLAETGAILAGASNPLGWATLVPLGAASMGAKTYTETGSPLAGVAQAGVGALLPPMLNKATSIAGKGISSLLYRPVAQQVIEPAAAEAAGLLGSEAAQTAAAAVSKLPQVAEGLRQVGRAPLIQGPLGGLIERGTEVAAQNLAAIANQELGIQATTLATTGNFAPFNEEHLTELAASTLPFTVLDLPRVFKGPSAKMGDVSRDYRSQVQMRRDVELAQAQTELAAYHDTLKTVSTKPGMDLYRDDGRYWVGDKGRFDPEAVRKQTEDILNHAKQAQQAVNEHELMQSVLEKAQSGQALKKEDFGTLNVEGALKAGVLKEEKLPDGGVQYLMDLGSDTAINEAVAKFAKEVTPNAQVQKEGEAVKGMKTRLGEVKSPESDRTFTVWEDTESGRMLISEPGEGTARIEGERVFPVSKGGEKIEYTPPTPEKPVAVGTQTLPFESSSLVKRNLPVPGEMAAKENRDLTSLGYVYQKEGNVWIPKQESGQWTRTTEYEANLTRMTELKDQEGNKLFKGDFAKNAARQELTRRGFVENPDTHKWTYSGTDKAALSGIESALDFKHVFRLIGSKAKGEVRDTAADYQRMVGLKQELERGRQDVESLFTQLKDMGYELPKSDIGELQKLPKPLPPDAPLETVMQHAFWSNAAASRALDQLMVILDRALNVRPDVRKSIGLKQQSLEALLGIADKPELRDQLFRQRDRAHEVIKQRAANKASVTDSEFAAAKRLYSNATLRLKRLSGEKLTPKMQETLYAGATKQVSSQGEVHKNWVKVVEQRRKQLYDESVRYAADNISQAEAINRMYNGTMKLIADLQRALTEGVRAANEKFVLLVREGQDVVTHPAGQLKEKVGKETLLENRPVTAQRIVEKLNELDKQEWGPAVFEALTGTTKTSRDPQAQTPDHPGILNAHELSVIANTAGEAALAPDWLYYTWLQRAGELADPKVWEQAKARSQAKTKKGEAVTDVKVARDYILRYEKKVRLPASATSRSTQRQLVDENVSAVDTSQELGSVITPEQLKQDFDRNAQDAAERVGGVVVDEAKVEDVVEAIAAQVPEEATNLALQNVTKLFDSLAMADSLRDWDIITLRNEDGSIESQKEIWDATRGEKPPAVLKGQTPESTLKRLKYLLQAIRQKKLDFKQQKSDASKNWTRPDFVIENPSPEVIVELFEAVDDSGKPIFGTKIPDGVKEAIIRRRMNNEKMTLEGDLKPLGNTWSYFKTTFLKPQFLDRINKMYDAMTGDPRTPEFGFAAAANAWFKDYYLNRGLKPEHAEMFASMAQQAALAFRDVGWGKIGESRLPGYHEFWLGETGHPHTTAARFVLGIEKDFGSARDVRIDVGQKFIAMAHGLTHALFDPNNRKALPKEQLAQLDKSKMIVDLMTPDERADSWVALQRAVVPEELVLKQPELLQWREERLSVIRSGDSEEFLADYAALGVLGFVNDGASKRLTLEHVLSPQHVSDYLHFNYISLFEQLDAVRTYVEQTMKDPRWFRRPEWEAKNIAHNLERVGENLKAVLRNREELRAATTALNQIAATDKANWDNLVGRGSFAGEYETIDQLKAIIGFDAAEVKQIRGMVKEARRQLGFATPKGGDADYGVQLNALERNFATAINMVKMYPMLRDPVDLVFGMFPMAETALRKMLLPLAKTVSKLTGVERPDMELTGVNWALRNSEKISTIEIKQQVAQRSFTLEELKAEFGGDLASAQKAQTYLKAMGQVFTTAQKLKVNHLRDRKGFMAAFRLMALDPTRKPAEVIREGHDLAKAIYASMDGDGGSFNKVTGQQYVASFATDPKRAKLVADIMQALEKVRAWDMATANMEWWRPLTRQGRWMVAWTNPKAPKASREGTGAAGFSDQASALKYGENLKRQGMVVSYIDKYIRGRQQQNLYVDQATAKLWQDIEQGSFVSDLMSAKDEQGNNLFDSDTIAKIQSAHTIGEAPMRELVHSGDEKFMRERKLKGGMETIDVVRSNLHYINALPKALARSWTSDAMLITLGDKQLQANPQLWDWAYNHYKTNVHPSAGEFSKLKRFIFTYFMGWNLSANIVELTQQATAMLPQIVRDTGGFGASYKAWARGLSAYKKVLLSKVNKTGDAALDAAIEEARNRQLMSWGMTHELQNFEELAMFNPKTMSESGTITKVADYGKTAADMYSIMAARVYSMAPRLNSFVALTTAFLQARDHGVFVNGKLTKMPVDMSKPIGDSAAFKYAEEFVRATMYVGGVANRPGFFSNLGKLQGVAGVMYSLGSYTFNYIGEMARLGAEAFSKNVKLSVAERRAAKKAFGQMLLTQTALAGAMGLPMVSGVLAVIQQYFPELEPQRNIEKATREAFMALTGSDEAHGEFLKDLAFRGLPFAVGGTDLSMRLGLGQMLGVSPYDGFSLKNLVGPVGSIVSNAAQAVELGAKGQVPKALETLLPAHMRQWLKVYESNLDDTVRDSKNRPIATNVSPLEKAMMSVGFKPTRIAKAQQAAQLARMANQAEVSDNSAFISQLAGEYRKGNIDTVREALVAREEESGGTFSAVAGARSVVDEVMDQTLPYDFARSGIRAAGGARTELQRLSGLQPVSELQRLEMKKTLERQIGVPGSGRFSPTELRHAQIIDNLRQQMPLISYQQAAMMADRLLRRTPERQLGRIW